MAPERAAAGAIDHRADLFACGCVLYEMLVGQRAFGGDTVVDTLHAIAHDEPEALSVAGSPIDAGGGRRAGDSGRLSGRRPRGCFRHRCCGRRRRIDDFRPPSAAHLP